MEINSIVQGDCEKICKNIDDKFVNLIFTSPPYAGVKNKYINNFSAPNPENYADWILPKIKEFYRILKDDGSFILNIDDCVNYHALKHRAFLI